VILGFFLFSPWRLTSLRGPANLRIKADGQIYAEEYFLRTNTLQNRSFLPAEEVLRISPPDMKASVRVGKGVEALFGTLDENLRMLEKHFQVSTHLNNETLEIEGPQANVNRVQRLVNDYTDLTEGGARFDPSDIQSFLKILSEDEGATLKGLAEAGHPRALGKKSIAPKSLNQRRYVDAIERYDMVFGIGPSGTGKTYLAVAMAIDALLSKEVSRIILARPAVEAGERLGFLPGTLQEKVNPYLRPLYDALYDVLDPDRVERYIEKGIIEIAPIAFMRGRTLNDAFVILDEAQNTTSEQMKMFLTRLGFNSKAVITGDITQIDLPNGRRSGLVEATEVVARVSGISFVYFNERDVVRHSLVQRIIRAYEEFDQARGTNGMLFKTQREDERSVPDTSS
jgi:phosphate starvation-inducible protein PhoH and related proteins